VKEGAELAREDRGAEAPEVPANDDAVRSAAKGDHPATAGPSPSCSSWSTSTLTWLRPAQPLRHGRQVGEQ
jgi:hypothetical protein